MAYTRTVISKHEKLLSVSRLHWIYLVEGLVWFLSLTFIGLLIDYYADPYLKIKNVIVPFQMIVADYSLVMTPLSLGLSTIGLAIFAVLSLTYFSTEIGLTNQRIIYKRGLISIHIDQIDLEDVGAEHVSHGILGWLLGYGRIFLDCRFVDDIRLPAINHPYKFIKASHNARLKNPDHKYDQRDLEENLKRLEDHREKKKMLKLKKALQICFSKAA